MTTLPSRVAVICAASWVRYLIVKMRSNRIRILVDWRRRHTPVGALPLLVSMASGNGLGHCSFWTGTSARPALLGGSGLLGPSERSVQAPATSGSRSPDSFLSAGAPQPSHAGYAGSLQLYAFRTGQSGALSDLCQFPTFGQAPRHPRRLLSTLAVSSHHLIRDSGPFTQDTHVYQARNRHRQVSPRMLFIPTTLVAPLLTDHSHAMSRNLFVRLRSTMSAEVPSAQTDLCGDPFSPDAFCNSVCGSAQ